MVPISMEGMENLVKSLCVMLCPTLKFLPRQMDRQTQLTTQIHMILTWINNAWRIGQLHGNCNLQQVQPTHVHDYNYVAGGCKWGLEREVGYLLKSLCHLQYNLPQQKCSHLQQFICRAKQTTTKKPLHAVLCHLAPQSYDNTVTGPWK